MRHFSIISQLESKQPIAAQCGGKQGAQTWYSCLVIEIIFVASITLYCSKLSSKVFIRYMIAYTNLLRCIENLGIAGAYGIRYYGQGKITHDNYVQMIRHFTLVDEYLEQSKNYVPQIGKGIQNFMFTRTWCETQSVFRIIKFFHFIISIWVDPQRKGSLPSSLN